MNFNVRPGLQAFLALIFVVLTETASGQATFDAIRRTEQIYEAGDYKKALQQVDNQLLRDFELTGHERARLYLLRARLLYAFDRIPEITFWLRKSHASDQTITLDPLLDPPVLIDTMRNIRQEEEGFSERQSAVRGREGSFLVGVMPFGIGHMDAGKLKEGTLFLATETLLIVASQTVANDSSGNRSRILGVMGFLGTYSYELLDMLPELMVRDRDKADSLRYGMNFAPFGVAQAKNGDLGKAFGFAALQSILLTVGAANDDRETRTAAYSALGISWVFSMVDGFSSFPSASAGSDVQFVTQVTPSGPTWGARYRF